jgi:branched-chain amino acid transport system ATP-binding protein
MLDVEAIHTYYGDSHILHGVSLRVAAGEAVALLGRNGAGKTTLIRSIMGFTPPREGRIALEGEPMAPGPPTASRAAAWRWCRRAPHLRPAHGAGEPRARRPAERPARRLDGRPRVRALPAPPGARGPGRRHAFGGEQQMLALGRALLTNGGCCSSTSLGGARAPDRPRDRRILDASRPERLSILLVEQNYHLALAIADRVYVMSKGQIVWEGTPAALESSEDIKRRYLGVA